MPTIGRQLRPLCAIVLAMLLVGCAQPTVDPVKNSVNQTLNAGGQMVTGSIAQMNRASVKALAEKLPVCIAYKLPERPPALNDTFKQVLADVTGALRQDGAKSITITAYQAQKKGGINPLAELVALKNVMPAAYKTSRMEYEPLPPPEFRKRAACAGKDTVLVVGTEIQFYRNEMPLATLAAGELPIDSVLFLVLGAPSADNADVTDEKRRPS